MVILFLTSSLEPGKDGVGDYTRLLAGECVRQNHECLMIALNDPYVSAPIESAEPVGDFRIPVLRLPASLDWRTRIQRASAFHARRPIDWISLQFVSYGFNRKGIVWTLARHLEPLAAGCSLHIMFHELWIGTGHSPPLKDRLMGRIQRHYLRKLIRHLKPAFITTSNPYYVSLLDSIRLPATELLLFGNIPIIDAGAGLHLPSALVRAGICDEAGSHPGLWLGLFFGALYPEWKPEPLLGMLISAAEKAGQRVCLVCAGRLGGSGKTVWEKLQADYAHALDFTTLGELPTAEISALMQIADFGLAVSPWHLLGKSGSAAAMLDHGLPVIVTRDEFQPGSFPTDDPLLHRCDAALEAKLRAGLPKRPPQSRLEKTTRDFIAGLTRTHSGNRRV